MSREMQSKLARRLAARAARAAQSPEFERRKARGPVAHQAAAWFAALDRFGDSFMVDGREQPPALRAE